MDLAERLRTAEQLPPAEQPEALISLGREVLSGQSSNGSSNHSGLLVERLVAVVASGLGTGRQRLELGEILGTFGDPRLHKPGEADYWVLVPFDYGDVKIGRHMVTNWEYKAWVDAGGYEDAAAWTDEGRAWLAACPDPWPKGAAEEASRPFVVANQPVVGVTYHEALAYATATGSRLPRSEERLWVTRGQERRPYPWGSPFGEGNANTREEVLGRPCAVGLFLRDRTPEGVTDLAGNAAEWMADEVGGSRLIHPGAWDQPSMAAWAKALALCAPDARWAGLGFRLAVDAPDA